MYPAPAPGNPGSVGVWSFDVAVTSPRLEPDGRRVLRPRWVRVVVAAERLVEAHLAAAQIAGRRGMVTDVRYRE